MNGFTPEWLRHGPTARILELLGCDRARVVGGAVRDSMLDRPISDIDIATQLLPETVMTMAQAAGVHAIPTGLSHGTVTLVSDDQAVEVTTLRRDVETDGRHAQVVFTDDWQADAARRDFTMNALMLHKDGTLFDYFGGEDDLRAGRVRFIGDAGQRIEEDALRILRFFRFSAHYAVRTLDDDGLAACAAAKGFLQRLSGERLQTELLKLLTAQDPEWVLKSMGEHGVWQEIIGADPDLVGLAGLLTAERAVVLAPDPLRRLAALLSNRSTADMMAQRLRLSKKRADRLQAAIGSLPERVGEALYRLGRVATEDRLLLSGSKTLEQEWRFLSQAVQPVFPLRGQDLITAGVAEGPAIGAQLKRAEQLWIASDFTLSRDELLVRLENGMVGEP